MGILVLHANADEMYGYYAEGTGNLYFIDDGADLFSPEEEEALLDDLERMAGYGNAGLITTDKNLYSDSEALAAEYIDRQFGSGSDTSVFVIDMDTRNLTVWSTGANLRKVTRAKGLVITDNVYRMASSGDYYDCAHTALSQIGDVLDGTRISQPMKYLSNAALAILLALILNYVILRIVAGNPTSGETELLGSMFTQYKFTDPKVVHTGTRREYSPVESSSSSSGSRSSGGGFSGGGGGGHSGGGGSHGF